MSGETRLQKIALHYGAHHQLGKLIEELGEAQQAAEYYRTNPSAISLFDHFAEELADAQIMIDQMRFLLPDLEPAMSKWRNKKLNRQLKRIAEEKKE